MATLIDYINSIAAPFMSTERGMCMVKRVKRGELETKGASTGTEWSRLTKMSRWHLYLLIARSSQEPSPIDASTPRNKSSVLFCTQALKCTIPLNIHASAPWSLHIFSRSNRKRLSVFELILRGTYMRNYTGIWHKLPFLEMWLLLCM